MTAQRLRNWAHVIVSSLIMVAPTIGLASQTTQLADGSEVKAEHGHVTVPERRDVLDSGTITIPYVRLLSEADQASAPVIYLEGGPGGSGTEALEDQSLTSLFKDVLASRDIILVDQRGTGDAKPELACSHSHMFSMAPSPTPVERLEVIERLSMRCADQVRAVGIDLSAYNSQESADDIADLARHLNVEKIVLLGASYGSHLALSVVRRHETLVEQALLALIEGPDDTFKRPRQLDDMLLALDAEAADPEANWPHSEPPSVAVEQALRQFDEPKMASWVDAYGRKTEVEIARHDLESVLFGQMGRDIFWRSLSGVVERLRKGDWSQLARTTINWREERVSDPMSWAMDCASGASSDRLAQIEEQLAVSIASIPLDFPHPYVCDAWGIEPLPESFRAPVESDVPMLLISGELDPRTPPSNADELAKGLSKVAHIRVGGMAHGFTRAYDESDGVREAIRSFLAGERVTSGRYSIPFTFNELEHEDD